MNKNALSSALWRTLGGVLGVAVLLGLAFALNHFVSVAGVNLG